jgi:hypothetical protein
MLLIGTTQYENPQNSKYYQLVMANYSLTYVALI